MRRTLKNVIDTRNDFRSKDKSIIGIILPIQKVLGTNLAGAMLNDGICAGGYLVMIYKDIDKDEDNNAYRERMLSEISYSAKDEFKFYYMSEWEYNNLIKNNDSTVSVGKNLSTFINSYKKGTEISSSIAEKILVGKPKVLECVLELVPKYYKEKEEINFNKYSNFQYEYEKNTAGCINKVDDKKEDKKENQKKDQKKYQDECCEENVMWSTVVTNKLLI